MLIRSFDSNDTEELLGLLNDTRLVGQPQVTAEMITATLDRTARIDQAFYDALVDVTVLVAYGAHHLLGAVAYGTTDTGVRDILWLEAREHPLATQDLLAAALDGWDGPVRAFWYAPTITAGMEGLPLYHRPVTAKVMAGAGFIGLDLWSYQRLELSSQEAPHGKPWDFHKDVLKDESGTSVAEFEVSLVSSTTGCLWWIETYEAYRGQGHGARALDKAISWLASQGAREVILYVDDDTERGTRRRGPAKGLYAKKGFCEIDRLWSFTRGNPDLT